MEHFFWSFWWLIFPLMWFVFGGFGMWMSNRRHRDTIDLMKTYAAQGKDPSEIAKVMGEASPPGPAPGWGGPGPWAWHGYGYSRWSRWGYWGPYREWRRVIMFTCLAVGFWAVSEYGDIPGAEHPFHVVAIIMGVLAAASFAMAVVATVISSNTPKNDK